MLECGVITRDKTKLEGKQAPGKKDCLGDILAVQRLRQTEHNIHTHTHTHASIHAGTHTHPNTD